VRELQKEFAKDIDNIFAKLIASKFRDASDGATRTDVLEDFAHLINLMESNGEKDGNADLYASASLAFAWLVSRAMGVGRKWFDERNGQGATEQCKKFLGGEGIHYSGVKSSYIRKAVFGLSVEGEEKKSDSDDFKRFAKLFKKASSNTGDDDEEESDTERYG